MQVHNTHTSNINVMDGDNILSPDTPVIPKIWMGTEAQYQAILIKDEETVYFTTDGDPNA